MREIRSYGSEGGVRFNPHPYLYLTDSLIAPEDGLELGASDCIQLCSDHTR